MSKQSEQRVNRRAARVAAPLPRRAAAPEHAALERTAPEHINRRAAAPEHAAPASRLLLAVLSAVFAFALFPSSPFALFSSPVLAYGDDLPGAVHVGPRGNTYADPANGIYVSPSGNDSAADGSIGKPYKSINAALAAAHPGDTIILRGGTYREGVEVRVRIPNITIKSAQGEWAVIDLTTYNSGKDWDSGVCFDVDSSGGKLQGVEVIGGFYAVVMETTWDWGPSYPTRYGASNIIIEDCILHDSRNDVVKVKPNCKNITIRYNEIYNSGREYSKRSDFNTGEYNSEGIDNVNGDGMHVHNNYIHDICSTGIYAKGGATDVLIENNRIERTYAAGIMAGFDTSPEFFDLVANPKYYESIHCIVRNNLIIDAGWEGIGLYASKDAEIYNNTIINAVCGVMKYHSPIYFGVATQDWENPAGCPPNVNPSIHHNVVSQPSAYTSRMIDIRYATGVYSFPLSALEGNPTMHDNCYYGGSRGATFTDNRPAGVSNVGLAAWKSHISGDGGSLEVNPALNDDYLTTNPQCAGMGIPYALVFDSLPSTPPPPPPPPPATYAVTVTSGEGSGSYEAGVTVNISASAAPSGKVFDLWVSSDGVSFANAANPDTSFTMPANAVTVTATYKDAPVAPPPLPTTYAITVTSGEGGTASANPMSAVAGTTIYLTATPESGYRFAQWQVTGGNASISNNTFTMPATDVGITAVFEKIPDEVVPNEPDPPTGGDEETDGDGDGTTDDGDGTTDDGTAGDGDGDNGDGGNGDGDGDNGDGGNNDGATGTTGDEDNDGETGSKDDETGRNATGETNSDMMWLWLSFAILTLVAVGSGITYIIIQKKKTGASVSSSAQ